MNKWFDVYWYKYLFAKHNKNFVSYMGAIWCRLKNHPVGPIYYNPSGWEPDMRCKNCGDEL